MKRTCLSILILLIVCNIVYAQYNEKTTNAIVKEDITTLLHIYNREIASRPYIENVLFSNMDLEKYSYSEIENFLTYVSDNTPIANYLNEIKITRELEIIRDIEEMTAEQIINYVTANPMYKSFVVSYVEDLLVAHLDSLNYYELCYIEECLPFVDQSLIDSEKKQRHSELLDIVKENVANLCTYEKQAIEQLCYKLEQRSLEYFHKGYDMVAASYSQIMLVPEEPTSAVSQYKTIVNGCLPSKVLQDEMQKEANSYCNIINTTREEFLTYTGKMQFPQLKLTIPIIDFNYSASSTHFSSLREIRANAKNSRSNSGWVSSAVKMLGGSFWGMLVDAGREIHDTSKGEKMANAEYECRRNYMLEVYNSIETNVAKQNKSIANGIRKELSKNQTEFIKYVQK